MKIRYILPVLLCALFALPAFMQAETTAEDLTNTELHQLILNLTDRVKTLESDLVTANNKIKALEEELEDADTDSSSDDDEDDDSATVTVKPTGNGVAVCHNGKTQYVNVHSALAAKAKGATIGICAHERIKNKFGKTDDSDDDDSEDEDDSDDDDSEDDDSDE